MRRLQRFFSRWQNWIGLLLVLIYIGAAVFAPYLSPNDPKNPGAFLRVGRVTETEPQPPSEKAVLGMLPRGIDVYHALIWGSRDALLFGLIVTVSTSLFGVFYGAVSGVAGNRLGGFLMRAADAFLAFPPLAGVVLLQQLVVSSITALGGMLIPRDGVIYVLNPPPPTLLQSLLERVDPLMLSLIVFSWMPYARLVHSIVLTVKQTEFVQAARALGGSPFWIIRRHILRNSTGPAIVLAARDVGGVVLLQATLTFIQIGGGSIWGQMLAEGRDWVIGPGGSLLRYWWVFLPPTLAVMLFGIAWNMLGDSLNDAFDPASRVAFRSGRRQKDKKEPLPDEKRLPRPVSASLPQNVPIAKEQAPASKTVKKTSDLPGGDPVLVIAREACSRDDLSLALHSYNHLIQRNRSINDILPDLAQLVKKSPRDPRLWQALGDALARAGDSEHATKSYEQAQKLKL